MKITVGTVARTIILVIALLNQVFAIIGVPVLGIDEATVYELCSLIFTVGASIVAWWKNNSFTTAAIIADADRNNRDLWG